MNAVDYLISIEQRLRGVEAAGELATAEKAARAAVESYKALEATAMKTGRTAEVAAAKLAAAQAQVAAAQAIGDEDGAARAARAVERYTKALHSLKAAQDAANGELGKAKAEVDKHAGAVEQARKASEKAGIVNRLAKTEIFDLETAFKDLGGPVGQTVGRAFELGEAFKKLAGSGGGIGLLIGGGVMATAVVVALIAALGMLAVAAGRAAISAANAARDQRLTLDAMLGTVGAGGQLQATYIAIAKATGIGIDRQFELTKQLKAANVSAKDMPAALRAIATQEAAIGQDETAELVKQLKAGSVSANKLAADIEKKYGGAVRQKMLGLDQLWERFRVTVGETFGGLKIDGLLGQLSEMVDLFDQSTASGRAMRNIFEAVFQPLVDSAASALPYIALFVVQMAIVFVKAALAVKPLTDKLREVFGIEPSNAVEVTISAATVAAWALVVVLGAMAVALAIVAVLILLVLSPLIVLGVVIYTVYSLITSGADATVKKLQGLTSSFTAVGKGWSDGLAGGLKDGQKTVQDAAVAVAAATEGTFRTETKTNSPSKLFDEMGYGLPWGLANGITRGIPRVEAAITRMAPTAESVEGSTVNSRTVTVAVELNVHGAGTARETISELREGVTNLFEGLALQLGGTPA